MRRYAQVADREVAGLVCATLALGGVRSILKACETLLGPLGSHPAQALAAAGDAELKRSLKNFRYRFFDGADLAALLGAVRRAREDTGSLEALFLEGDESGAEDYVAAASAFVKRLVAYAPRSARSLSGEPPWRLNLLPDPARGSASKRLFLYLRWMIRSDAVDPGGWTLCSPSRLLVPLDTHMGAACRALGILKRSSDDLRAVREASARFRRLRPDDPIRYDFALTRPGIHPRLVAGACFELRDTRLATRE